MSAGMVEMNSELLTFLVCCERENKRRRGVDCAGVVLDAGKEEKSQKDLFWECRWG